MSDVRLILGGARSGKTTRGLAVVSAFSPSLYIATAEGRDDEMRERIARHRAERGAAWTTIEEPLDLRGAIGRAVHARAILVDCLTFWISNLMEMGRSPEDEAAALVAFAATLPATMVFISNEVGMGIVPDNALARAFRDAQGRVNQIFAAKADQVELVVAGLPLKIK
jgi:adenosylcobinamide kinase/adenosylcobinamide-phosphate guanylyltransferase